MTLWVNTDTGSVNGSFFQDSWSKPFKLSSSFCTHREPKGVYLEDQRLVVWINATHGTLEWNLWKEGSWQKPATLTPEKGRRRELSLFVQDQQVFAYWINDRKQSVEGAIFHKGQWSDVSTYFQKTPHINTLKSTHFFVIQVGQTLYSSLGHHLTHVSDFSLSTHFLVYESKEEIFALNLLDDTTSPLFSGTDPKVVGEGESITVVGISQGQVVGRTFDKGWEPLVTYSPPLYNVRQPQGIRDQGEAIISWYNLGQNALEGWHQTLWSITLNYPLTLFYQVDKQTQVALLGKKVIAFHEGQPTIVSTNFGTCEELSCAF